MPATSGTACANRRIRFSTTRQARRCGGCRCLRWLRRWTCLAASSIEWGGAQRWLHSAAPAEAMRAAAAAAGGHATLFRGAAPSPRNAVFHPLTPAVAGIQRRLKQAFDPAGIFNPGRLGIDI